MLHGSRQEVPGIKTALFFTVARDGTRNTSNLNCPFPRILVLMEQKTRYDPVNPDSDNDIRQLTTRGMP